MCIRDRLQSQLLANYPLAQGFFKGLGVAVTGKDGQLQMPSLLGLLTDPIAWFTDIGLFELPTLQSVLTALPDVGTGGLALQTITNGKRVAGRRCRADGQQDLRQPRL